MIDIIGQDFTRRILGIVDRSGPVTANSIADQIDELSLPNTQRFLRNLCASRQVIEVGMHIQDNGHAIPLYALSDWTAPFDPTMVRQDLVDTILRKMSRRHGDSAQSLMRELNHARKVPISRQEIDATLDCLVKAGKLTSSRVGPLACYHALRENK